MILLWLDHYITYNQLPTYRLYVKVNVNNIERLLMACLRAWVNSFYMKGNTALSSTVCALPFPAETRMTSGKTTQPNSLCYTEDTEEPQVLK